MKRLSSPLPGAEAPEGMAKKIKPVRGSISSIATVGALRIGFSRSLRRTLTIETELEQSQNIDAVPTRHPSLHCHQRSDGGENRPAIPMATAGKAVYIGCSACAGFVTDSAACCAPQSSGIHRCRTQQGSTSAMQSCDCCLSSASSIDSALSRSHTPVFYSDQPPLRLQLRCPPLSLWWLDIERFLDLHWARTHRPSGRTRWELNSSPATTVEDSDSQIGDFSLLSHSSDAAPSPRTFSDEGKTGHFFVSSSRSAHDSYRAGLGGVCAPRSIPISIPAEGEATLGRKGVQQDAAGILRSSCSSNNNCIRSSTSATLTRESLSAFEGVGRGLHLPRVLLTVPASALQAPPTMSTRSSSSPSLLLLHGNQPRAQISASLSAATTSSSSSDTEVEDVDALGRDDPVWVSCYSKELYEHFKAAEAASRPDPAYLQRGQCSEAQRANLINILLVVCRRMGAIRSVPYLAVNILDRYLASRAGALENAEIILVGITALLIACKQEELSDRFCIADILRWLPEAYDTLETRRRMVSKEMDLLCALSWDVGMTMPTIFTFLSRYTHVAHLDSFGTYLARCITERALLEYSMLVFPPSLLAAAAVCLARCIDEIGRGHKRATQATRMCANGSATANAAAASVGWGSGAFIYSTPATSTTTSSSSSSLSSGVAAERVAPWNTTLAHYTGYSLADLRGCVRSLQRMFVQETAARARNFVLAMHSSARKGEFAGNNAVAAIPAVLASCLHSFPPESPAAGEGVGGVERGGAGRAICAVTCASGCACGIASAGRTPRATAVCSPHSLSPTSPSAVAMRAVKDYLQAVDSAAAQISNSDSPDSQSTSQSTDGATVGAAATAAGSLPAALGSTSATVSQQSGRRVVRAASTAADTQQYMMYLAHMLEHDAQMIQELSRWTADHSHLLPALLPASSFLRSATSTANNARAASAAFADRAGSSASAFTARKPAGCVPARAHPAQPRAHLHGKASDPPKKVRFATLPGTLAPLRGRPVLVFDAVRERYAHIYDKLVLCPPK